MLDLECRYRIQPPGTRTQDPDQFQNLTTFSVAKDVHFRIIWFKVDIKNNMDTHPQLLK